MICRIAMLPGDGIGPEILTQAEGVLYAVGKKYGHEFTFDKRLIGGAAIDEVGDPLPRATLDACRAAHAVMLGAVGGPRWNGISANLRPEKGLLQLRKELGLYANLRPAKIFEQLVDASPVKSEIVRGIDLVIVRELTGGLYFGAKGVSENEETAFDNMTYTSAEVARCAQVAFQLAAARRRKLTLVDKENVLCTSKLWRATVQSICRQYPDVEVDYMYVDNAAMQLVMNPGRFDVILTENMFGDILSDEASVVTGSIGLLPSASIGNGSLGLYEPIHGSAPDIAGKDRANPLGTILSAALMLRLTFQLEAEALAVEAAVEKALNEGLRTADIARGDEAVIGTRAMGQAVMKHLQ